MRSGRGIGLLPFLAMLSAAAGANAGSATECEVLLDLPPAPLYGTMMLSEGVAKAPGLLILRGSGPVDRDGNFPGSKNDSLKLLARGLAERGIASLRIDKRGIGASREAAPDEAVLRVRTYAEDAAHWLDRFHAEPRISRLFILGHSEGALIAPRSGARSPGSSCSRRQASGSAPSFAVNSPPPV